MRCCAVTEAWPAGSNRENRRVPPDLLRHTRLRPVPLVPELSLYQADDGTGLWTTTGGEYHSDRPPPFWLFAWAGGQALARYLLDNPHTVAGARVLDLATGGGLVAIAAARAGAARVRAVDTDPDALAVTALNAAANGVTIDGEVADVLDRPAGGLAGAPVDVVLAGDVFYTSAMAGRAYGFLRWAGRQGARVLVGDAERGYFPTAAFEWLAGYRVPVTLAVEETELKDAGVWQLRPAAGTDDARPGWRA
jgi:predicted nicotinamide N-methyase